jgi:ribosome biogenesis protein ENP2
MRLTNHAAVPVYTVSGSSAARQLPEHLARKRKRDLKKDPEYANRIELLQDFEFEEASCCVRVSPDGQWIMSTGKSRKGFPLLPPCIVVVNFLIWGERGFLA